MDATISMLQAPGGAALAIYDWGAPSDAALRGTVLLVHGLGEHMGRYADVAHTLRAAGWHVWGHDHHGHGRSDGLRGALPAASTLLDDLGRVIDHARERATASRPLVLVGHSMGGAVVAQAVMQRLRPIDAVVMSSPALAAHTNALQRWLLRWLPRVAPQLRIGNGLQVEGISRDPVVVQRYRDDPLVHDRMGCALAAWIVASGQRAVTQAHAWDTPTLLLYAGADRLVDPAGSDAFARAAPATLVHSHRYDALYHEIFNEPEREEVLAELVRWLAEASFQRDT
ncbi:MAG: alpha/beta hydrolase [Betaproteobacteria bacterium]|nr:alpha/beta hydrolase [Betaproteobacteria bacterium]